MRMCGRCGAENPDDADFCGQCGAFLEFDEAPPAPTTPIATTPVATTPVATTPIATTPIATAPAVAEPAASASGPAPSAGPAPSEVQQPAAVPSQPGVPAVVQPGEAVPQRRRRQSEAIDDRPRPGDLLCLACGTGNPRDRRFCRRCGQPISAAAVARLSWWRRLRNRLRRRPLEAGYRPPRRRRVRILVPAMLVLVVAGVVVSLPSIRPAARHGYEVARGAVQDRFSQPVQTVPKSASASSSAPATSPAQLIDGANNTYWAPAAEAPATGEWLRLRLEQPAYVAKLLITSGVDVKEDTFRTQARPATIEITARREDGTHTSRTVQLVDRTKAQEVNVRTASVTEITITIRDAYGSQPGRRVGVAEVEVFVRR